VPSCSGLGRLSPFRPRFEVRGKPVRRCAIGRLFDRGQGYSVRSNPFRSTGVVTTRSNCALGKSFGSASIRLNQSINCNFTPKHCLGASGVRAVASGPLLCHILEGHSSAYSVRQQSSSDRTFDGSTTTTYVLVGISVAFGATARLSPWRVEPAGQATP
jgi:hypothetical protein